MPSSICSGLTLEKLRRMVFAPPPLAWKAAPGTKVDAAGLSRARVETLRRGCLVHDLGKIGVPDLPPRTHGRLTRRLAYPFQERVRALSRLDIQGGDMEHQVALAGHLVAALEVVPPVVSPRVVLAAVRLDNHGPVVHQEVLAAFERIGWDIIRRALEEPLRQIAENAGYEGSVEVQKVKAAKPGQGFDAMSGDVVDMVKAGIVEPFKVTRSALQNAASIGALVLTTETLIADKPEPKQNAGAGAGGGMGGMGGGYDMM